MANPLPAIDVATPSTVPDGRRNRTVETRRRIVKAFSELIREGRVAPTAEEVSARADVGLRTVFRHFDDMETLYREVNTELDAIIDGMLQMELKSVVWQDRLLESIKVRGRLYEGITPFFVSAHIHRHESAFIDSSIQRSTALERAILKGIVPKSIQADKPRFEALLMALSPEAWVRLRREQGLGFNAAVACLQLATKAIIAV